MTNITLCAISTDGLRITRLGFESDDQPLTKTGYDAVSRDLWAPGSTARFRSVGATDGVKLVDVTGMLGSTWPQTEANVRAAFAQ